MSRDSPRRRTIPNLVGIARSVVRRSRQAAHRAGLVGNGNAALRRRLERLLATQGPQLMSAAGVPGLAVVVSLPGGERIARYWGIASPPRPDGTPARAVDASTVVQAMSITKPVTAMAIVRLAHLGLVDLDAPVSTYLRSWTLPPSRRGWHNFEQVTLRRLLSHTAGTSMHSIGWSDGSVHRSPVAILDRAHDPLRLLHAPGSTELYSGGGYVLAQLTVEDATGRPFADLADEHLLAPLGMTDSSYSPKPALLARIAATFEAPGRPSVPRVLGSCSASGLYTTAADLCTFMESLLPGHDGRGLISPAAARAIITRPAGSRGRGFGLGFHLYPRRSDTAFSHRGYGGGWWSEVDGFPSRRCAIVAVSNGDPGEACVKPLVAALRQRVFDYGLEPAKPRQ